MITETLDLSYETTKESIIGAQLLSNKIAGTNSQILEDGELASKSLTGVAVGLTLIDAAVNGPKPHHAADVTIDLTIYAISAEVPVLGWVVGGVWFAGNLINEHYTGKSMTEEFFDQ